MIQIICGRKGSGKTKQLIARANKAVAETDGSVYFLNVDRSYTYELKHQIRFINTSDYNVVGAYLFLGFLDGLAASNYDLKVIFIDGFLKHMDRPVTELEDLFNRLEAYSKNHGIDLVLSVSLDKTEIPGFLEKYLITI